MLPDKELEKRQLYILHTERLSALSRCLEQLSKGLDNENANARQQVLRAVSGILRDEKEGKEEI